MACEEAKGAVNIWKKIVERPRSGKFGRVSKVRKNGGNTL